MAFKKVLIITTHFAPDIHVGAKRMTKFAKYLPACGWQPVVLTKETCYYHGVDVSLVRELPPEVSIHRVHEWHLTGLKPATESTKLSKFSSNSGAHHVSRCINTAKCAIFHFMSLFLFYDYSWLLPTFLKARQLIRKQGIKLIYSSMPDCEAHLVALLLKLTTHVKWVCEYRDPWTRRLIKYYPHRSVFKKYIDNKLEKIVLKKADHLLFVGSGYRDWVLQNKLSRFEDKATIIFNGYDESDFTGLEEKIMPSDIFTITYVGTWGKWISPEPFLKAMGEFIRIRPELKSQIIIRFIGEVKYDSQMAKQLPIWIKEEGLQDIVRLNPFLSHSKAIIEMFRSQVLLMNRNYTPEQPKYASFVISAKLFEYFRSGRPILAIVPPDGDAAKLIRENNAGIIVSSRDIDGIVRNIEDLFNKHKNGLLNIKSKIEYVERFERKQQTKELSEIFNELILIGN